MTSMRLLRALVLLVVLVHLVGCAVAQGERDDARPDPRTARGAQSDVASGVVFVHGTGDQTPDSARSDYWTDDVLARLSAGLPYLVVGYAGATYAADDERAWGDIARQIDDWTQSAGIERIVIVTHSNGSNPVRYLVHHPNASSEVRRVVDRLARVVTLAGDDTGTPLADKVTTAHTVASIAQSVGREFGLDGYDGAAVWEQRTDEMAVLNQNGTFDDGGDRGGTTLAGTVPVIAVSGTSVYAAIWSSDAYCGGYGDTAGLKATLIYGWGSRGCADGFVGCDSAQYVGYAPEQGIGLADARLNHQQSRRGCHGSDGFVAGAVTGAFSYAAPADYVVAPSAQACNATTRGWDETHRWYWYGCDGAHELHDGALQPDCFVAYGQDESLVAPRDFARTAYAKLPCDDAWRGDGVCDLCLVAKYGYDVREGSASGADDCVQAADGARNVCRDVAWDASIGGVTMATYQAAH